MPSGRGSSQKCLDVAGNSQKCSEIVERESGMLNTESSSRLMTCTFNIYIYTIYNIMSGYIKSDVCRFVRQYCVLLHVCTYVVCSV